ncbi:MAG: shikimate dehydrogenase, partial [Acidimicrobiales bacterium]
LAGPCGRTGDEAEVDGAELIVNATPVGMQSTAAADDSPLEGRRLGSGQLVFDMIYHPPVTPLMALASERGARVANGVGMLVYQASQALRLWTGQEPSVEVMRAAALAALSEPPTDAGP